jgi:hypothetical protein
MPRDVAPRTLPADPTNALHAAPKQYAEKAKVSANDTTAGYLNGKLVAGDNITLTEVGDGGNETLEIAAVDPSVAFPVTFTADGYAKILYVVGAAKHAVWYGVITGDGVPVTIVPDDANDVTIGLTLQSIVYCPAGLPWVAMRTFDQETTSRNYAMLYPDCLLTPGREAFTLLYADYGGAEHKLEIHVSGDGEVILTPANDGATYYVSLSLMWF